MAWTATLFLCLLAFANASQASTDSKEALRPHGKHHMFHRRLLRHRMTHAIAHPVSSTPVALPVAASSSSTPAAKEVTEKPEQVVPTTSPQPEQETTTSQEAVVTTSVQAVEESTTTLAPVNDVDESQPVVGQSKDDVVMQLRQELQEVKARRQNINELEQALAADTALVHEGEALVKVSSTRHGREAALRQVQKSKQLLQATEEMLRESHAAAVEGAKSMLDEAQSVQTAADALATEAREQLHIFSSGESNEASEPEPQENTAPVAEPQVQETTSPEPSADQDVEDEN